MFNLDISIIWEANIIFEIYRLIYGLQMEFCEIFYNIILDFCHIYEAYETI